MSYCIGLVSVNGEGHENAEKLFLDESECERYVCNSKLISMDWDREVCVFAFTVNAEFSSF